MNGWCRDYFSCFVNQTGIFRIDQFIRFIRHELLRHLPPGLGQGPPMAGRSPCRGGFKFVRQAIDKGVVRSLFGGQAPGHRLPLLLIREHLRSLGKPAGERLPGIGIRLLVSIAEINLDSRLNSTPFAVSPEKPR